MSDQAEKCPDCCAAMTREQSWDPWRCPKCYSEFAECGRCSSFVAYNYSGAREHRIEGCITAIGERLAKLEGRR